MAFESHVFENGRWVTRTTNLNELLNKTAAHPPAQRQQHAPQCGIMTRTLVHSPVAHWILSVRLRSSQHNDVAFVGDHYVQISELRRDGQLHSIQRKCDFGSRIRNARVIGTSPVKLGFEQYATTTFHGKATDDDDLEMMEASTPNSTQGSSHHHLPPQLLLIVLETGDCVFLFLRPDSHGNFEFVALQHSLPSSRLVRPGFHLAVDPSSRYAAQACSRNMFVVHELESTDNLNYSLARGQPLRPIISSRPRHVTGIIHSIEFLYPRPQDPHHVILLLIIVSNGITRMVTYDWELGDDLRQVLADEKAGHILPPQHEMPLMVIPLTVRSAFFVVSEEEIAYCADVLHGSPSFEPCAVGGFEPTKHHEGSEPPLWTAWSRPPRLYPYNRDRDFIYLAREDGMVIILECDTEDILAASFCHGTFCRVSTAFASLADDTSSGEILVFGGDSGQGGVWSAVPRGDVTKLCRIPNWSPTVDFVTTNESNRWDDFDGATTKPTKQYRQDGRTAAFVRTDKIYAAAGTGSSGSIVEYRHGLQASIGIEVDFGTAIRRCFMLEGFDASGYHLLLSVRDKSALLYFDPDFSTSSAGDIDQNETFFDLSSPTLIAQPLCEGLILQVTETGLMLLGSSIGPRRFSFASLGLGNAVVTDAAVENNLLAVTSHIDNAFQVHFIKLDTTNCLAEYMYAETINQGEVTALCLYKMADKIYGVAYLYLGNTVLIERFCVTNRTRDETILLSEVIDTADLCEPVTSVACITTHDSQESVLVAGTRDGLVMTISLTAPQSGVKQVLVERVGSLSAHVYPARTPNSVIVCCGHGFYLASDFREAKGFHQKQNIWTVDADDSSKFSPIITSVTALTMSLSGNESNVPLLLLASDRFYLAELQPHAGPVQRHIPLGVTPQKLLYSHVLKCLVVAVRTSDNKSSLRFIDPITGEDLSVPQNGQTKESVDYIKGLGIVDDRIQCLEEWHVAKEGGHSYYYIFAGTRGTVEEGGRLLIISAKRERPQPGQTGRGKIKFWTRHKIKAPTEEPPAHPIRGPVYAVTTSDRRIQTSIGTRLLEYKLDESDRKIAHVGVHDLGAPVWKLAMLPDSSRTVALVKGESIRALEAAGPSVGSGSAAGDQQQQQQQDPSSIFTVTHVEPASRPAMDMLEVAGEWDSTTFMPIVTSSSEPNSDSNHSNQIVLVSDQNCSLAGLWVPWDTPGRDCEVLFEADLPSSIRRLRLGRVLPAWSREKRKEKKYGLLPASVHEDAQILGMGIDGSMQHFTLLGLHVWRFLRFVQNISETSAELYPFTHIEFEDDEFDSVGDGGGVMGGFDPVPEMDRRLEMQVDGDLMQRCLDNRSLEGLIGRRAEWGTLFREYLDGVDGGRWTKEFVAGAMNEDEVKRRYFALAYDILEYFLVPII